MPGSSHMVFSSDVPAPAPIVVSDDGGPAKPLDVAGAPDGPDRPGAPDRPS